MHRNNPAHLVIAATILALGTSGCTTASIEDGNSPAHVTTGTSETDIPTAPLDDSAAALLPKDIAKRGELVVGIDPTFSPYEFYASDSKTVIGWDADFAQALGETLGITVKLVPATFDTILPGVSSGKFDVGISAFDVTPERLKNADFAVYQKSGSALAVQAGNPKNLDFDALSLCGATIGGEKGTSQGIEILPKFSGLCEDSEKPPIKIQLFPTQTEANMALVSGRVDGIASGTIALGYSAKLSEGGFELASENDYEPTPVGVALPKNSPLTPAVVAGVKAMVAGDTYQLINTKYGFPHAVTISPEEVFTEVSK